MKVSASKYKPPAITADQIGRQLRVRKISKTRSINIPCKGDSAESLNKAGTHGSTGYFFVI